ncbi:MAG: DUF5050 domain-containing protein [bacterium]|nr:DUF5050 domain-containing protein [bacterium]
MDENPAIDNRRFLLGDWLVQPDLNRLILQIDAVDPDNGSAVMHQVEPRVMETLVFLARHSGQVVSRRMIMDALWGETVVVEAALTRAISELRNLLGDDSRSPQYIETIRKGGYRLIAEIEWRDNNGGDPPPTEGAPLNGSAAAAGRSDGIAPAGPDLSPQPSGAVKSVRPQAVGHLLLALVILIPILIYLGVKFIDPNESPDSTILEGIPFTTFPGTEHYPAMSPDGGQVAFCWRDPALTPSNLDIYIKQRNTETPLRLTSHRGIEAFPTWSPDGTRIAFSRSTRTGPAIMIIPSIGGEARKITRIPSWPIGLDWSPDGRHIAFAAMRSDTCPDTIYLLDVMTGEYNELTTPETCGNGDIAPHFSPDGTQIAFVHSNRLGMQDLFVIPTEGGESSRITRGHRLIYGLDWSRDGRSITFSSRPLAKNLLWRVDVQTSDLERLHCTSEGIAGLSLAANADCMVFEDMQAELNIWAVYTETPDSVPTSTPLISSTRWDSSPAYSTDGKRVAFISTRSGGREIWVCNSDGTNPIQYTFETEGDIRNLIWSPSDRYIGFTLSSEDNAIIHIMDSGGGLSRPLSKGEFRDVASSWSRDGDWIYFDSYRDKAWNIWKLKIEGGEVRQVTTNGGLSAKESHDGQYVYFSKNFQSGIFRLPVTGGEEECITTYYTLGDCSNWGVMRDGLYFASYVRGGPVIGRCDFDGKNEAIIMKVANITMGSLTATADGKTYLYGQMNPLKVDLMLIENLP